MDFSIVGGRDPFLMVKLERGESVFAESNAMVTMDTTLDLESEMRGGMLGALSRKLTAGESLFTQTLQATRGAGEALFAPGLPGDIEVLEVNHETQYLLNDGVFLAAESTVNLTTRMQGLAQAAFGGTGGFLVMRTAGHGRLAVAGFGSLFSTPVEAGQELIIDNQHVVAWDARLSYSVSMRTSQKKSFLGSIVNAATSGEGLVTRFSGTGRIYLSSRNMGQFVEYLKARIAAR